VNAAPARGFTLVELLVVLALIALVIAVASPVVSNAFPGAETKAAARELATGFRFARSEAITGNREVGMVLDLENRRYGVGGEDDIHELPEEAEITLVTARSERIDERTGVIRFFPDGSSTGGGVSLAHGNKEYRVMVDWLTGRVRVFD
jgi:general secretion pathway protein H